MAAESKNNSGLAFVLGGVVVVLGGLVWYLFSGGELPAQDQADIRIELPDGDGNS